MSLIVDKVKQELITRCTLCTLPNILGTWTNRNSLKTKIILNIKM